MRPPSDPRGSAWRTWCSAALLTLSISACDGPAATDDAGVDAGTGALAVTPPSWAECPLGWAREAVEGAAICTPAARVSCEGATFQPLGASACEPVDDRCGAGRFRELRDEARSYVFVDASAEAGGDGSEASPFQSVDAAIASGALSLLLAEGDYTIGSNVPDGLELRGVCADRTHLVAPAGRLAILVAAGRTVALVGLSVTGTGIGPAARGILVLDRVVLDAGLDGWGAGLNGGTLVADRVLVRAPHPSPGSAVGLGLSMIAGSSAVVSDLVVEDAHGVGIQVEDSSFEGDRVVVVRTRAEVESGLHGGGISAAGTATLTLRDALVSDVVDFGIVAQAGASATLERVVIEDVVSAPAETSGRGLEVWNSTANVGHLVIQRATAAGIHVREGGELHASDVLVRGTQRLADFGAGVLSEGSVELDRTLVLDSIFGGLVVGGGTLTARDLGVRRVEAAAHWGGGLACSNGGRCTLSRFSLEDLHTIGLVAVGAGTHLEATDGAVRRVGVEEHYDIGRGIEVDVGATATLRAIEISDVVESGVVAFGLEEDGTYVEGTRIDMTDVTISGIAERACASSGCAAEAGGTGVSALASASISATNVHVRGAPLCGVQVFDLASLDLTGGTIEGSAIGACVQIEGYDLARIVGTARFVDNERNVETASVYVPARGPSF
ncbi:MAG: right-handed parallel beta-helix repeat-containing protein [Sandaracinaceae bacterium]|nr:right-handed parallel beta-helix repeat-containing protein [Sandaracinaceae bacterium]